MISTPSFSTPTRVYLIDSQSIVRAALRSRLDQRRRFVVVGGSGDVHAAIKKMHQCRPDILLLDFVLPPMAKFEAMSLVQREFPDLPIVIVTHQSDDASIARAMNEGARAYVSKDSDELELLVALDSARMGFPFVSPRLVRVRSRGIDVQVSGRAADEVESKAM
jgi:DNA-binding NarL/FixJ family response regulator